MKIKAKSRIIVFIFSLIVWVALTDIKSYEEVIVGILLSIIVSLLAGHFLITTEKSQHPLRRIMFFIIYIFRFFWEMIKANFEVAYLVIHPLLPIKPGIVKIKTKLSKDSAMTILGNSITLTPGTLTVDANREKQELYIHCIKVEVESVDESTKRIGQKFENILMEVFE